MLISSVCLCFIFLSPSLSVFVSLHLHLFQSTATPPRSHLFPPVSPPCCLVKMTESEDMMEYFLSSLWISLCMDLHAHTDPNTFTSVRAHTERPMHHIKVSRVRLTVMSLISVGYQWDDCHTRQRSADRTISREEIWGSESVCVVVHVQQNKCVCLRSLRLEMSTVKL